MSAPFLDKLERCPGSRPLGRPFVSSRPPTARFKRKRTKRFLKADAGDDGEAYFGAEEATSFWNRGSLRRESNIGSSRSNAGVSGGFAARGASYGIESSFCKVEIERSRSCGMRAATRARMSSGLGPVSASLSIGNSAIARRPDPVPSHELTPRQRRCRDLVHEKTQDSKKLWYTKSDSHAIHKPTICHCHVDTIIIYPSVIIVMYSEGDYRPQISSNSIL
jgi:hypothetical protein